MRTYAANKSTAKLVKQDGNLAAFPLFAVDRRSDCDEISAAGGDYRLFCAADAATGERVQLPAEIDHKIFLYILYLSQESGWSPALTLRIGDLVAGAGLPRKGSSYGRVREALVRLSHVSANFSSFRRAFSDRTGVNAAFHFISHKFVDDSTVLVCIDQVLLSVIHDSRYFVLLDTDAIRQICGPVALRLYEILRKETALRQHYIVDAADIADRIGIADRYLSDMMRKIRPALGEVNRVAGGQYTLAEESRGRGSCTLRFTSTAHAPVSTSPASPSPRRAPSRASSPQTAAPATPGDGALAAGDGALAAGGRRGRRSATPVVLPADLAARLDEIGADAPVRRHVAQIVAEHGDAGVQRVLAACAVTAQHRRSNSSAFLRRAIDGEWGDAAGSPGGIEPAILDRLGLLLLRCGQQSAEGYCARHGISLDAALAALAARAGTQGRQPSTPAHRTGSPATARPELDPDE